MDALRKVIDDGREVIERIGELVGWRRVAMTKPRIIRRNQVVPVGEPLKQWLIHSRCRRKSMQEQDRGRSRRTRLAIEDLETVDFNAFVTGQFAHRVLLCG